MRRVLKVYTLEQISKPIIKREALVGRGGFGYAYQGFLGTTQVCIKVAKLEKREAYYHEAKILKILNTSPLYLKVPKFYSLEENSEEISLIMECLGKSLEQIKSHSTLNLTQIGWIAHQIIVELEKIHKIFQLIHGDIKPENILFNQSATELFLIDFGFSTNISKENIQTPIRGTTQFLSPYLHQRQAPGARDDLFSLGYTLIYLYQGSLPWKSLCQMRSRMEREEFHKEMFRAKQAFDPSTLPLFFQNYFKAINKLEFDQLPNYDELKLYALQALNQKIDNIPSAPLISREPVS